MAPGNLQGSNSYHKSIKKNLSHPRKSTPCASLFTFVAKNLYIFVCIFGGIINS